MAIDVTTIPAKVPVVDDSTLQNVNDVLSIKDGGVTPAKLSGALLGVDTQIDATEYTENTETITLKKTFTFTPTDADTVITHIRLKCDLKSANAGHSSKVGISINGTNLEELFCVPSVTGILPFWSKGVSAPSIVASITGNAYKEVVADIPCHFKGDTSYSIKVWLVTSLADTLAYLDEQELKVFFSDYITEQA